MKRPHRYISRAYAVCFGNERGANCSANAYVYLYTHVHMYVHDPAYIHTFKVFFRPSQRESLDLNAVA